jgi:hypothetical protein
VKRKPVIPEPDRVRKVAEGFGWLDHRLLREGWLEQMMTSEIAVYVFLVLAADRHGVSFYRREKIARILGLDIAEVARALGLLVKRGLVAFKPFSGASPDGFHQVLDVPACSVGQSREERRLGGAPEAIGAIVGKLLKGGDHGSRTVG